MVQGDTNTAFAGCLLLLFTTENFLWIKKIKIIHIEAGLRSFDEKMPEEINRDLLINFQIFYLFLQNLTWIISIKKDFHK